MSTSKSKSKTKSTYLIAQQPSQHYHHRTQLSQKHIKHKSSLSANQQNIFIQRLRQVLQNNRQVNNNNLTSKSISNTHNINYNTNTVQHTSHTVNKIQNTKYNNVHKPHNNNHTHSRYISQIINPNNQSPIQKQPTNQQQILYPQKQYQNQTVNVNIKLPQLKHKKKKKYNNNNRNNRQKYNSIDIEQKSIIKNYMNVKLIQYKPNRSNNKNKRTRMRMRRNRDSVGELPVNSNKKYYRFQTPIQNLSKYTGSQMDNSRNMYRQEFGAQSQFMNQSYYTNNKNYDTKNNNRNYDTNAEMKIQDTNTYKNMHNQYTYRNMRYNDTYTNNNTQDIKNNKQINLRNSKKQQLNKLKQQPSWQPIDPLNYQTYFIKLRKIGNTSLQNTKIQRNKQKLIIPQIPSREQISQFIKNYLPYNEEIKIQQLIKSSTFQIIKDQSVGEKSFYFGETQGESRQGYGVFITQKIVFQGLWKDDMKVKGIQITATGKYKGQFKNELRQGKGQFFWAHGEYYSGEWKQGKKNGSGYWKSLKGESYMGQWKNGQVTGYGVHNMKTGQKYEGQFVNFLKHGFGRQIFPNHDIYEGRYVQGHPHGKGKYQWKNGTVYEGQFVQGFRQGKGTLIAPNILKFEGNFKDQIISGMGKLQTVNGDIFNGMFENNKKNGPGILDMKSKHQIIKGIWQNNELVKQQ